MDDDDDVDDQVLRDDGRAYLSVHDAAGVAAPESVRAKVGGVAALAVDVALAIGGGGRIEPLVAHAAGEAVLVPLSAGADDLLGVVHRLGAPRALGSSAKLGCHLCFYV